jgi:hypothetical protein
MHATIEQRGPTVIPTPLSNDSIQGAARGSNAAAGDECQLLAELTIIRGRRHYFYDGYQYDCLSDAVAYGRLVQRHQPVRSSPAQLEAARQQ